MSPARLHLLLVGLGGVLGASARWSVNEWSSSTSFPWHTLAVNVVGCAGLALVTSLTGSTAIRRFLGVGFFGGLTTFSTFSIEIVDLLDQGRAGVAASYCLASIVLGLAAFVATRRLASGREARR